MPWANRYSIGLLPAEKLSCIEEFAIDMRHHRACRLVCDVRLAIEEIAFHHQASLLRRPTRRIGIAKLANSFGTTEAELSFDLEKIFCLEDPRRSRIWGWRSAPCGW